MFFWNKCKSEIELRENAKDKQVEAKKRQHEFRDKQEKARVKDDADRYRRQGDLQKQEEEKHKEEEAKHNKAAEYNGKWCGFIVLAIAVGIFRQLCRRYVDCAALTDNARVPHCVSYGEGNPDPSTYLEGKLLKGTVQLGHPTQYTDGKGKRYTGVILIHRLTLSKMYR